MSITRRMILGTGAATAWILTTTPCALAATGSAPAAPRTARWTKNTSANGWPITGADLTEYPIEGADATVTLASGAPAHILAHIARRWHYEIAPVDTGEGGGITAHTTNATIGAVFESNNLSGTALTIHPGAYPLAGAEGLWPHQEAVVRDILLDCEGTVAWGGHLTPAKYGHFHISARPGSPKLSAVADRLRADTPAPPAAGRIDAGAPEDPQAPARRVKATRLARAQKLTA